MKSLKVLPPRKTSWIELGTALNWIVKGVSQPIPILPNEELRRSKSDELLARLQPAWGRIADAGSGGRLKVRGRPMIKSELAEEVALTVDDFRLCATLGLVANACRPGEILLCARINARGDAGYFDDFVSDARHGFALIVVAYADLMALHSVKDATRQLRSLHSTKTLLDGAEAEEEAAAWLHYQLSTRTPKSETRDDFLAHIVTEFRVSGRAAKRIWANTTADFLERRKSGRPPASAKREARPPL